MGGQGVVAADRVDPVFTKHITLTLDPLGEGPDLRRARELFHIMQRGSGGGSSAYQLDRESRAIRQRG